MDLNKLFESLDVMPGKKTKILLLSIIVMAACQKFGYYQFDPNTWTMVWGGTGLSYKMGMDREKKK